MRRWTRVAILVAFSSTIYVRSVRATTYYVDYNTGSDSNAGTSKASPWKHAPGMLGLTPSGGSTGDGCTAICASTTMNPGDSIILKGGVVWPYTTLPWNFSHSGSGSTSTYGCTGSGCIYIGYDSTWNAGVVNSVTLTRDLGGCNPSSAPTVFFSGGGGNGAAATAYVIPSAAGSVEPNVAGFVYKVVVTNGGSGYTSDPTVSISGDGCTGITAVADIYRPVIDAGGSWNSSTLTGSGPKWPVGTGSGALEWGPGLTVGNYVTIDHIEIRNIYQQSRTSGVDTAFFNLGNYDTLENSYAHGRYSDCILASGCSNGADVGQEDSMASLGGNDEIDGNTFTNGESYFTGTSSTYCGGTIGNVGQPCEYSESGIHCVNGGSTCTAEIQFNYEYCVRWMVREGMSAAANAPLLIHNNEFWLVLYDTGGAHINELYVLNQGSGTSTPTAMYEYDNIFHSAVSGASNQQQMGNGNALYYFNNVSWGLGGGTSNWGIDASFGAGPNGAHFYFYNNTMFGESSGTRNCIDGSGAGAAYLTVTLQNNLCITSASPYWNGSSLSGATVEDQAGSTNATTVNGASTVQSASTAASQGYTVSDLFAPTSSSDDTVTFASNANSANLTSLCTGYLVPLCSDINGNSRPTGGGWQAGAYQYGSGTSQVAPPAPPAGLTAIVQ